MLLLVYRARQMLQYSDDELSGKGGYDLIHPDDCNYYSAAHQERTSCCHSNRVSATSHCLDADSFKRRL